LETALLTDPALTAGALTILVMAASSAESSALIWLTAVERLAGQLPVGSGNPWRKW
jgi:hypothetical protein